MQLRYAPRKGPTLPPAPQGCGERLRHLSQAGMCSPGPGFEGEDAPRAPGAMAGACKGSTRITPCPPSSPGKGTGAATLSAAACTAAR
jgi:hypothetical protein